MNHCRFLNRRSQVAARPGAAKRMENVFRPFVCNDPHRNHALPQELGASLKTARDECRRRCPAKFGLSAEPAKDAEKDKA